MFIILIITVQIKKHDTLSVPYDYKILSSVILYTSRIGRVWWCEDTDLTAFPVWKV